jgi:integrase
LRAIVEAALETGCRRGELLSLQWSQISGLKVTGSTVTWAPRAELFLPHQKTKTETDRKVPISTRLKSILEMKRFDPTGKPHALDAYVFGNTNGQKIDSPKRAWMRAVFEGAQHHADVHEDDEHERRVTGSSPEDQFAFSRSPT